MKFAKLIMLVLAFAVFGTAASGASFARQGDQDRALELRKKSDIIPYGVIAKRAESRFGGRVVGQRVREMDGKIVYELRLLKDDGTVLVVYMDAKTGAVIKTEGR